jgi:hypothetical protein
MSERNAPRLAVFGEYDLSEAEESHDGLLLVPFTLLFVAVAKALRGRQLRRRSVRAVKSAIDGSWPSHT